MPVPLTVPGVIDEFIQARHVWPRSVTAIRHFGLHTPEGPEMPRYARNLGAYFRTTDRVASTHFGCDNELTVRYARDDQTCAAAAGVNTSGIHIEIAGVASQSEEQWLDAFSRAALQRAANVFKLYGPGTDTNIPVRMLTAPELARGLPGIVKHSVAWAVYGGDFRSDPGHNFPDELFLAMCRGEEEEAPEMLTPEFLENGWRRYNQGDLAAFEFVRASLAKVNKPQDRPGASGANIDAAIVAFKRANLPGDTNDATVRPAFWRALIVKVAGVELPSPVDPNPELVAKVARLESSVAQARGHIARAENVLAG
jgi:hypothetical protein